MNSKNTGAQSKKSGFALARGYVMQNAPYFAHTLYAFIPTPFENLTEVAGGPLAVTERLVLLYDPEWVKSIDMETLATGLCHEVMHDQLRHIARGKAYPDKQRFNLAGDLFINGLMAKQMRTMKDAKGQRVAVPLWKFPEWAAMPAKFGFPDGLTADAYYQLLEKKSQEGGGKKAINPKLMCGGCGGVAGNPGSHELEKKHNTAKGRSEAECRSIAHETSKAIKDFMQKEGRGLTPGGWSEFFNIGEEVYTVPWRQKLANVLRYSINNARVGGLDYSMRRPSARSYLRGWPLPGLISYDPEIGVVVDSSGSMGKPQIGSSLRVISDVMEQTGVRSVWFMEADAAEQRAPIRVTPRDLREIEIKGRGGTDFTPAIEYMQKFQPRISVLIYCTDGDGAAPAEAPTEFETIWGIVPSSWSRKPTEWGHTIMLGEYLEGAIAKDFDDED